VTFQGTSNIVNAKLAVNQMLALIAASAPVLNSLSFNDVVKISKLPQDLPAAVIDGNKKYPDIANAGRLISAMVQIKLLSKNLAPNHEELVYKQLLTSLPKGQKALADFCERLDKFENNEMAGVKDMMNFAVSSLVLPKLIEVLTPDEITAVTAQNIDAVIAKATDAFVIQNMDDKTPIHLIELSNAWHKQDYSVHTREFSGSESWYPIIHNNDKKRCCLTR